jgi:hypothetical protein
MPFEERCATELLAAQTGTPERPTLLARAQALRASVSAAAPALQPEVQAV